MRLEVQSGIGRLSASFGDSWPDITLAFCGRSEPEWLHVPKGGICQIEALTTMRLRLHRFHPDQSEAAALPSPMGMGERDLITEWLLDLQLVRYPVGTDTRLASLLRLLVARLGIRMAEGYRLPFSLGHARLAELICATRSTVTRQLMLLRQAGLIQQDEPSGGLLFSPLFVEEGPQPRPR
ncbi:MAG: hypothetical protein RLZZ11_67 [Cyanobacteriota bacterium]|jgi:hypothetical protein